MKKIFVSSIFILLFINCSSKDEIVKEDPVVSQPTNQDIKLDNPINDFVWKAMNSWYNWQANVPNLADTKDDNQNSYHTYLNSFSKPNELFTSLKYSKDDFSWFIEDYEEQQQSFQGITKSFGFRPGLVRLGNTEYVIMYIQHVSKNSPADKAEFKRGDLINGINDVVMTVNNYRTVLNNYYQPTATFNFVGKDGVTPIKKVEINQEIVTDNPVDLVKIFDDINGKKVGYLLYNGFRSSYNDELNAAFAEFKTAGIQELILDFRINGGGSVETCTNLASMIYKEANKERFAELRFNQKHSNENSVYNFRDTQNVYDADGNKIGEEIINRLSGLTRLYVLASGNTASASEMIINGLRPFINVKVVGTKTVGKNEGSITLYDLPETDYLNPIYVRDPEQREQLIKKFNNNPHKNAMQPIVFQIYNKLGQSDYSEGFPADISIDESSFWINILPFGNENEVVLKAALDDIRGISSRPLFTNSNTKKIEHNVLTHKFQNEMYITSEVFYQK